MGEKQARRKESAVNRELANVPCFFKCTHTQRLHSFILARIDVCGKLANASRIKARAHTVIETETELEKGPGIETAMRARK